MRPAVYIAMTVAAAACTGPKTVAVEVPSTDASLVTFAAYREGSGSWRMPTYRTGGMLAPSHLELSVTDEYQLVVAFADGQGGFSALELLATPEDGTRWDLLFGSLGASSGDADALADVMYTAPFGCFPPGVLPPGLITGEMQQAGIVTAGTDCLAAKSQPWQYAVGRVDGTYDLIATDPLGAASPRLAITRAVTALGPTPGPAIDLGSQGSPLDTAQVVVANASVTSLASELSLFTGGAAAVVASDPKLPISSGTLKSSIHLVPPALLVPDDRQLVHLTASDSVITREAFTHAPDAEPVYEFLTAPRLTLPDDGGAVSWTDPLSPRVGFVDLDLVGPFTETSPRMSQHVTATPRWLAAHGATSLAFDASAPGYDPAWTIDTTAQHVRTFSVRAIENSITYVTTAR